MLQGSVFGFFGVDPKLEKEPKGLGVAAGIVPPAPAGKREGNALVLGIVVDRAAENRGLEGMEPNVPALADGNKELLGALLACSLPAPGTLTAGGSSLLALARGTTSKGLSSAPLTALVALCTPAASAMTISALAVFFFSFLM